MANTLKGLPWAVRLPSGGGRQLATFDGSGGEARWGYAAHSTDQPLPRIRSVRPFQPATSAAGSCSAHCAERVAARAAVVIWAAAAKATPVVRAGAAGAQAVRRRVPRLQRCKLVRGESATASRSVASEQLEMSERGRRERGRVPVLSAPAGGDASSPANGSRPRESPRSSKLEEHKALRRAGYSERRA